MYKKNPIGADGFPMEKHHPGRLDGETILVMKTVHNLIHEGEINAVREIFKNDGLKGNPNGWTAKVKK